MVVTPSRFRLSPWLFRSFETNSSKKYEKKNNKKPKNINELESEGSENYFSTSEDEINDIETTHEENYGENYEENLEENFKDNFKENSKKNFEQNFEKNVEDNLEQNFEEKFKKTMKRTWKKNLKSLIWKKIGN